VFSVLTLSPFWVVAVLPPLPRGGVTALHVRSCIVDRERLSAWAANVVTARKSPASLVCVLRWADFFMTLSGRTDSRLIVKYYRTNEVLRPVRLSVCPVRTIYSKYWKAVETPVRIYWRQKYLHYIFSDCFND